MPTSPSLVVSLLGECNTPHMYGEYRSNDIDSVIKMVHIFLDQFRILAFSPNSITSVRVWVDKHPLPRANPVGGGPLYVSPWQPEKYSAGLHTIQVIVKVSCLQSTVTDRVTRAHHSSSPGLFRSGVQCDPAVLPRRNGSSTTSATRDAAPH